MAQNYVADRLYPGIRVVEAGRQMQFFSSGALEKFRIADSHFFQGFQAIGYKGRAEDSQVFNSLPCQFYQGHFGIGLKPGFPAQAGLKADAIPVLCKVESFSQGPGGGNALGPVAELVFPGYFITAGIVFLQAISLQAFTLFNLSFGKAVKAEKEMVIAFFLYISSTCYSFYFSVLYLASCFLLLVKS